MKSILVNFQNLRLALSLGLTLCSANVLWSAPSIQSIDVSPNPLISGETFVIVVTGSPDATQATATVDFHPRQSRSLEVPLTKQGAVFTGSGVVPTDFRLNSHMDEAKVKVVLFDSAGHRAEEVVHVDVNAPTISAVFAAGTLTVTGDNEDNALTVSRDTAGTILVFVNGASFTISGGVPTVTNTSLIRILGLSGNDVLLVDDTNGPMPPANLLGGEGNDTLTGSASDDLLDGGPGNDTLFGRDGHDRLLGGTGNDILIGGRGDDEIFGGDGDDQIVWNPGDGSDLVEGEGGVDTLLFIGANVSEIVDLSANGARLRFFRNVANITMDCDGVEQVIFRALGGADQVTVNDLTGTQVTNVVVDLFGTAGTGDGQRDSVLVNGTETNDIISVTGSTNGVSVFGLTATVTVLGGEKDLDELIIDGRGGVDVIDASAVQAGAIGLTINGGRGNDVLIGGEGDDVFIWNPGDGSDVVEGEGGQDTLLFNGANIAETIDVSANGQRLRFSRNVANIVMDCDGIEIVQFNALGGGDIITVNELTGTTVKAINLDLAAPAASGIGDNAADTIIVNGTSGDDVVTIASTSTGVSVFGFSAVVSIVGSEPALDQLIVRLLAGDDVAEASALQAGVIQLTLDGGPGDDVLIGSAGADTLLGNDGDDVLRGGPGLDILDGGPGNNVLIQD